MFAVEDLPDIAGRSEEGLVDTAASNPAVAAAAEMVAGSNQLLRLEKPYWPREELLSRCWINDNDRLVVQRDTFKKLLTVKSKRAHHFVGSCAHDRKSSPRLRMQFRIIVDIYERYRGLISISDLVCREADRLVAACHRLKLHNASRPLAPDTFAAEMISFSAFTGLCLMIECSFEQYFRENLKSFNPKPIKPTDTYASFQCVFSSIEYMMSGAAKWH